MHQPPLDCCQDFQGKDRSMCYSAAVRADYAAFRRLFPRSRLALKAFFDLYWRRRPPLSR